MATTTIVSFFPLLFVAGIIAIVIAVILINQGKTKPRTRYLSHGHQHYVPGEFSPQMELDIRLPYRRFKQLYPGSQITYPEYKQLQMRTAFRRSRSSQENKRMVR